MMLLKNANPEDLLHRKIYIECECILHSVEGYVVDFERFKNETIYILDVNKKIIRVGNNHPGAKYDYID